MDDQERIDRGLTLEQLAPVEGGAPGNFVPDVNDPVVETTDSPSYTVVETPVDPAA